MPELKANYNNIFKAWLLYGNIPWVIMMIGMLSGLTQNTFEYLNPKNMNLMVLLFHFSIILIWVLSIRWVYFKNGAEFLEKHSEVTSISSLNEHKIITSKRIKILFPIGITIGIIVMLVLWNTNIAFR